jgi:hypothetical protein
MRFLLGLALFVCLLQAEPSAFYSDAPEEAATAEAYGNTTAETDTAAERYSDEPEVVQKVLYLSYVEMPERIFKGELFSITVKVLSTEDHFEDIGYTFSKAAGCKLLNEVPERRSEGHYFYDTFHFIATGSNLRTPDLTASLRFSDFHETSSTTLAGKSVDVVTLNPPRNYANILAEHFEITNYKTTRYNRGSNIVVFSAKAGRSDIELLKLSNVEKQGIESVQPDVNEAQITYFAIIPSKLESLNFSYFNLKSERFTDVLIPVIVEDDTVSTQSDLKPTEHKHTTAKIAIAAGIAGVSFLLFVFRRKIIYFIGVIIPALYIAYAAVPIEYACIKEGSPIYLLPMENSTTFEVTSKRLSLEVQGSITGFKKIKLENNKIGWVKNEDLCVR